MAVTIKQVEGVPASYPATPSGLSAGAAAIATTVWQRIESYIAHRWTPRSVTWIVDGCGEWVPPLTPATISAIEVWSAADEWETAAPSSAPLGGYWLPASGPYRFTATVGGGTVPAAVNEAFKRLAEYLAQDPGTPGASSERKDIVGVSSRETARSPSWMAKAMQNSGAGDLLRDYRRA